MYLRKKIQNKMLGRKFFMIFVQKSNNNHRQFIFSF